MAPIFGQNHANARLYVDISPGVTNHPGNGLDPPPQTSNAQMNRDFFMVGLPLVKIAWGVSPVADDFTNAL